MTEFRPEGPPRTLILEGSAHARGRCHGEAHAAEIQAYTRERVELAAGGVWAGRRASVDEVLDLANRMIPAHRAYAPEVQEEMEAMAAAAGISVEEAIIVGGFTDFVDAVRAAGGPSIEEDDCTAALVPKKRGGPWFAQTWDMHASATPYVLLLDLRPPSGPSALVFTTVGCVGQIGLNSAGICVGITNLSATNGRVGVTWPHVVRKVLAQSTLDAALRCVLDAPVAGAHTYMIMDARGRAVCVEAFPGGVAVVTEMKDQPLIHTNHCLWPATKALEAPKDAGLLASSTARLEVATELLSTGDLDFGRMVGLLREPSAVCRHSEPPAHIESSGATIVRPQERALWACWGPPDRSELHRFEVFRG